MVLANLALGGTEFYVSPTVDDSNPGTKSKPFASLERARDSVRLLKRQKPEGDYTVLIRGGLYRLKDAVRFSVEDSAAEGHTVTYAAYPKERPVFSSAVPITGWKQEGNLWVAELHESVKPFYTLYDRSGRLPRARSKPFSPTLDYRAADKLDRFTLPFPTGTLRVWSNLRENVCANIPFIGIFMCNKKESHAHEEIPVGK